MIENWRIFLYPLGFLASLLFGIRFFVQWTVSEKKKESTVMPLFWQISIVGNVILALHSFIQIQFHVCLVQMLNIVIAWRNLNLMQEKKKIFSTKQVIFLFFCTALITTLAFIIQGYISFGYINWVRTPQPPWEEGPGERLSFYWHLLGSAGVFLFASRFWIQWWGAEKSKSSELNALFWWLSILGATSALVYFIKMEDSVHILGHAIGIIPYFRNIALIRQTKKKKSLLAEEKNELFLFAGEQSGDLHGGKILAAMKENLPSMQYFGVGGPEMRKEGMECFLKMENFQVMGFADVLKSLLKLRKYFNLIAEEILRRNPKAVLFIDYPGFNLRMAKKLRKKGYKGKLIHYICPTIWAWRKYRKKTLVDTLDLLLTIYPFEKKIFEDTTLPVKYVGNLLVNKIAQYNYDDQWANAIGLPNIEHLIGIFPGSRKGEIKGNLLTQLNAAEKLLKNDPQLQFAISIANEDLIPLIEEEIYKTSLQKGVNLFLVSQKYAYELMRDSRVAIATSGTVTLELALHKTATVVVYHVSFLNWVIARLIMRLKLPHYCIVNIIFGKAVFPELTHKKFTEKNLLKNLQELYQDTAVREKCIDHCRKLKKMLFNEDPAKELSKAIEKVLQ